MSKFLITTSLLVLPGLFANSYGFRISIGDMYAHVTECTDTGLMFALDAQALNGSTVNIRCVTAANNNKTCEYANVVAGDLNFMPYEACGVPVLYLEPFVYYAEAEWAATDLHGHETHFLVSCTYPARKLSETETHINKENVIHDGGHSASTAEPFVTTQFVIDGHDTDAAELGKELTFDLNLKEGTYAAIRPWHCKFTTGADHGLEIEFVRDGARSTEDCWHDDQLHMPHDVPHEDHTDYGDTTDHTDYVPQPDTNDYNAADVSMNNAVRKKRDTHEGQEDEMDRTEVLEKKLRILDAHVQDQCMSNLSAAAIYSSISVIAVLLLAVVILLVIVLVTKRKCDRNIM